MTKTVVDIVNFNADASCLSSSIWLDALQGGTNSKICQWLELFVRNNKKVSLGFTGSTLADIKKFNPDAINIICLLYTSPSPRDKRQSRMPSSA